MMYYILPLIFLFTGLMHLIHPDHYVEIIPPFFPYPYAIAILSGVAELVLAAGLAYKKTRWLAGWATIVFLIAVFPANVYMYMIRDTHFQSLPAWLLLARLPGQLILVWWAWAYTRPAARA